MNPDEIRTVHAVATAVDAAIGTNIAANYRRYIYRIKTGNQVAGPNQLTLGHRQNGALATTVLEQITHAVQYEQWLDPEDLKEDAVPLYIVEGAGAAGASSVRVVTNNGNCEVTLWYADRHA